MHLSATRWRASCGAQPRTKVRARSFARARFRGSLPPCSPTACCARSPGRVSARQPLAASCAPCLRSAPERGARAPCRPLTTFSLDHYPDDAVSAFDLELAATPSEYRILHGFKVLALRVGAAVVCAALLICAAVTVTTILGADLSAASAAPVVIIEHEHPAERIPIHSATDSSSGERRTTLPRERVQALMTNTPINETKSISLYSDEDGFQADLSLAFNATEVEHQSFVDCINNETCSPTIMFEAPVNVATADGNTTIQAISCDGAYNCTVVTGSARRGGLHCDKTCLLVTAVIVLHVTPKGCFPADTLVLACDSAHGTSPKPISRIKIGDEVMTSEGCSQVFLHGHVNPNTIANFVQAETEGGRKLQATPYHFVIANGVHIYAKDLKPGDRVKVGNGTSDLQPDIVRHVTTVTLKGLFNPYTVAGDILVSASSFDKWSTGILASVHSDWFLEDYVAPEHVPTIYQALLAPVRLIHAIHPKWTERFGQHFNDSPESLDQQGFCKIIAAMATTF